MRRSVLVLAFSLLWMAAPRVLAAPDDQARARMRFEVMDTNGDGEVSRAEWRGSARSFAVHDWNGDGKLSGDEVRLIGAQRAIDLTTVDHDPSSAERYLSYTQAGFRTLDHNRDNLITRNEWHHDAETFRRIDANRDNALTPAEFIGTDVDDLRDDRFDDIDVNNDGRVSRSEWYGGTAAFNALDRNHDGVLSRFEVVGAETYTDETLDQFRNLDYDNNGAITRDEWHWSAASFNARDLNGNGTISRQEFTRVGAPAGTAAPPVTQPRTVRVDPKQRWTDTGLDVQAGDIVAFNSTGTIQMSGPGDSATPAGSVTGRKAPDAPILNQPAGALIARVGDFSPIFVGGHQRITAPVRGRVYLGVNDDYLDDNAGEFAVVVSRSHPLR